MNSNLIDRFERGNHSFGNDGEKSQFTSSRNVHVVDHVETGSTNLHENPDPGLIPLDGCSTSVAAQIMNERMYPLFFFSIKVTS